MNEDSKPVFMEMGCYGLGVSRLLAAVLEVNSSGNDMRWPVPIAPYLLSIIPPKVYLLNSYFKLGFYFIFAL